MTFSTLREVTPEWERLMKIGSALRKGSVEVVFHEGKPVQANILVKKIRLNSDEDFKSEEISSDIAQVIYESE